MNHYQIYLHNEPNPVHAQGDSIETRGGFLVIDRDGTVSFACPTQEVRCIFVVDPESLPSKEEFLEQQRELMDKRTDLQKLRVEHKALHLKNNELREERRKAMDAKEDAERALAAAELKMSKLCGTFLCTLAAIAIVAIVKIYWS